jgi:hypothetical protein
MRTIPHGTHFDVRKRKEVGRTRGAYRLLFDSRELTMTLTLATPRRMAEVTARAHAEFLEMPGLRLTLAQTSRLCGATPEECARALDQLIADGFLCLTGDLYVRANAGWRCA